MDYFGTLFPIAMVAVGVFLTLFYGIYMKRRELGPGMETAEKRILATAFAFENLNVYQKAIDFAAYQLLTPRNRKVSEDTVYLLSISAQAADLPRCFRAAWSSTSYLPRARGKCRSIPALHLCSFASGTDPS